MKLSRLRRLKSFFAIVLIFSIFSTSIVSANSNQIQHQYDGDIYADNLIEEVIIDDVQYTFEYSYNEGSRQVIITDSLGNLDVLQYELNDEYIYVNEEPKVRISNGWNDLGSSSTYVSWAKGMSVAVVAGAIGIAISGNFGAAGVIACIGLGTLSVLASGAVGGTVHNRVRMHYDYNITYEYRWSFTASTGDSYGPFTSYEYIGL